MTKIAGWLVAGVMVPAGLVASAHAAPMPFPDLPGQTQTFGFFGVTQNDPTDTGIGESQLSLTVRQVFELDFVFFELRNLGPHRSSITSLYLDDDAGVLGAFADFYGGDNVAFMEGATPTNLPGQLEAELNFLPDFLAGIDGGPDGDWDPGINPGEFLGLGFLLTGDSSFDDVVAALADGSLRMGAYVTGFMSQGSESFITHYGGPSVVPTPAAAGMGLMLLAGALLRRRG